MVGIGFSLRQHLTQQLDLAFQAPVGRDGRVVFKGGRLRFREPVSRPVGSLEGKRAMQLGRVDSVATPIILGRAHASTVNGVEQGRLGSAASLRSLVQRQRHSGSLGGRSWSAGWSVSVPGTGSRPVGY